MGHSPHPMDSLQVMGSPPSYPPNAIVRRMAGCTQASQSKSGPHAKPFGPSLPKLHFIGKSLAMSDQSELLLIEAQVVSLNFIISNILFDLQVAIQAKDILQRGLQHMSDDAIQQAAHAKQASRETRCLCVILTAWEIGSRSLGLTTRSLRIRLGLVQMRKRKVMRRWKMHLEVRRADLEGMRGLWKCRYFWIRFLNFRFLYL